MSKDDDYNKYGEDFKNMFKHSRRVIRDFLRRGSRKNKCGGLSSGFPPFFSNNNPLLWLFYPKLIVAGLILLTLLFCGVSLYGIIVILLLTIIFFLI
jgi:hypothetical protein